MDAAMIRITDLAALTEVLFIGYFIYHFSQIQLIKIAEKTHFSLAIIFKNLYYILAIL
jgi:hypothetical protein